MAHDEDYSELRLFISYARDDKGFVYSLENKLQGLRRYSVWIDKNITGGSRWWDIICNEIEKCTCFIAIFSQRAIESIYCAEELNYALLLNKPILPIKLKDCILPVALSKIQYIDASIDADIDKVLLESVQAFGDFRVGLVKGKYKDVIPPPLRPEEPKLQDKSSESLKDVYARADENAAKKEFAVAEKLYLQIMEVDPK